MSWRSIRINQFSSCAFCVENEFCVENDFGSSTSWKSILHLSTYSIPLLCILCGKWFWINYLLRNHITFEHPNNPSCVHFVWKMILNQRSAEEPCYIWAPNQFTIPLSLSIFRVDIWSLALFPVDFSARIRSCKLCGQDFSIDSWLKMHIISKYQSNSQDLALSFFLVLWSLFSILRHLRGVWIGDLWKET